jgi:biotin transport system substrate-specific component
MSRTTAQTAVLSLPYGSVVRNFSLVVAASLLMAICARISVPLPFTPVPLTLGNFAVLLIGLVLGGRRGMAAMLLYLAEGAAGLPVFSPAGPGGLAQLLGPTGGYLMAYPVAALAAGWIGGLGKRTFSRLAMGALAGEVVLFAGGLAWLGALTHARLNQAVWLGLYPFLAAEVIKVLASAGLATRLPRFSRDGSAI